MPNLPHSDSSSHTRSDGLPLPHEADAVEDLGFRQDTLSGDKVQCNACPVLCQISPGRTGACDRYSNEDGQLIRLGSVVFLKKAEASVSWVPGQALAPSEEAQDQSHNTVAFEKRLSFEDGVGENPVSAPAASYFVTGVGSSTTYPDYKPAPFIVSSMVNGVDMITVVTEGIFSYCSLKVKIDTDRFLGPEEAHVLYQGEVIGHVSTAEYGSQMLSLGGVHHLTGGSKKEGRLTLEAMLRLGNCEPIEVSINEGAQVVLQAGQAPIVNGIKEERMRVGCGSAAIGIFAQQWLGLCDEVVVVDDHITGVLTEHMAGQCLNMPPSGISIKGKRSTPGRYFQVAKPGTGWGGTDISDPLSILDAWDPKEAFEGLRLLMTSTTGEHAAWFVLDGNLIPQECPMPKEVRAVVDRIGENCEPSMVSVLFLGGAGGSLRAGVTDNPIMLTKGVKDALVNVTCGGAPTFVWPGGGITVMVDVTKMPKNSFGSVPTPAIVAPIEFSMTRADYERFGGHMRFVRTLENSFQKGAWHNDGAPKSVQIQNLPAGLPWPLDVKPPRTKA